MELIRQKVATPGIAIGAAGSFLFKVGSVGFSFLISVVLTRIMGVAEYGAYAYAITWVNLLIIPALFGLDQLLLREMSIHIIKQEWSLIRGLLRWSNVVTFIISTSIALIAFAIIRDWQMVGQVNATPLKVGLVLLPILALSRLRQEALRAFQRVLSGHFPEMIMLPLGVLILCGILFYGSDIEFSAELATSLHVVSAFLAFLVGSLFLYWFRPNQSRKGLLVYKTNAWLLAAIPFLALGGMRVINARVDTVMLGMLSSELDVGIYTPITKGAQFVSFSLIAVNAVIAPKIAQLHQEGRKLQLQNMITRWARIGFAVAIPIALLLIIFGRQFLLIFGPELLVGRVPLTILTLTRLFDVAAGPTALTLTMTGYEKDVAVGVGLSALLNFLINLSLIPRLGVAGAAIATGVSLLMWNALLIWRVRKHLKINTTIFKWGF